MRDRASASEEQTVPAPYICITLARVRFTVYSSALRHGITAAEIRTVIEHPIVRYTAASRTRTGEVVHMFVGGDGNAAWIETAAEQVGDSWHVFHAMLLTPRTCAEVRAITADAVILEPSRHQRPESPRHDT